MGPPSPEGRPGRGASAEARASLAALEAGLAPRRGLVVALSGGVDSSLLLAAAARAGVRPLLAVTVASPLVPSGEVERAREVAAALDVDHRVLELDPLAIAEVRANPKDRCAHCKRAILSALFDVAREEGLEAVAEGSNRDDEAAYRPGRRAVRELGVLSPLAEAGLGKADVRALAAELGLPSATAPSMPCLATRIPYGEPLELERLCRIDRAEAAARRLVAGSLRVRDHGTVARLEVEPAEVERLGRDAGARAALVAALKAAGYLYVALDLEGYRSGAMDEAHLGGEEGE